MHDQARCDAARALELDPKCGAAAVAMAYSAPAYGGFLEQDYWFKKAFEWSPSDSFTLRYYGMFAYSVGRGRQSVALLREAARLDPLSPEVICSLGAALNFAGELDEADGLLTEALARWPDFIFAASSLVYTLAMKGEFARARAIAEQYQFGHYRHSVELFLSIMEDPRPESRARAMGELRRQFAGNGRIELDALVVAGHLGYAGDALDLAETAEFGPPPRGRDARSADLYFLRALFTKLMPEVRRNPRFVGICAKLGLAHYWIVTDEWPDCVEEVAPCYDFKAECRRVAAAASEGAP